MEKYDKTTHVADIYNSACVSVCAQKVKGHGLSTFQTGIKASREAPSRVVKSSLDLKLVGSIPLMGLPSFFPPFFPPPLPPSSSLFFLSRTVNSPHAEPYYLFLSTLFFKLCHGVSMGYS